MFKRVWNETGAAILVFTASLGLPGGCGPASERAEPSEPEVPAVPTAAEPAAATPPVTDTEASADPDPATLIDSDADGLSDANEARLGTSPFQADTDGDGYSDAEELLDLGFDPSINPYRFNPRIADVPTLDVRVRSAPRVLMNYTVSETESKTFDSSSSSETSRGVMTNTMIGSSVRAEIGSTIGSEMSATVGVNAGSTASINSSISSSLAQESSFNWSDTQSQENRETISSSRGYSSSNDITTTGGRVEIAVDVRNAGHIAATLQTIALSLQKADPYEGRLIEMGQLEPDSARAFFDVTSLAPGETLDSMVFFAEVPVARAEQLLGPGRMVVKTSHYELLDPSRRSFDLRFTEINARTSTITIDPGEGERARTHFVSSFGGTDGGMTLREALTDVLRLDIETGTVLWRYPDGVRASFDGIVSLDGVAADPAAGGYWTVRVETDDGRGGRIDTYNPLNGPVDLDDIRLAPVRSISVVYISDEDRDGLGSRTEMLLGLDPTRPDTDRDGIPDGEELRAGSNPLHGRASASIIGAQAEGLSLGLTATARGSDGGELTGVLVDWGDGTAPTTVPARDVDPKTGIFQARHVYASFGEHRLTVTPVEETGPLGESAQAAAIAEMRPPLTEAWDTRIPGLGERPTLAQGPAGEVYVRYARRNGDSSHEIRVARIDETGDVLWDNAIETVTGTSGRRSRAAARLLTRDAIATDSRGNIYVVTPRRIHVLGPGGGSRWSGDAHIMRGSDAALSAVTISSEDRAFVTGSTSTTPGNQRFITRIDPGPTIAWTKEIEGMSVAPIELIPAEAGGIYAVSSGHVAKLDRNGEPLDLFLHNHSSVRGGLVGPDGTLVLAGARQELRTETHNRGGRQRQVQVSILQAGLWGHAPDGPILWAHEAAADAPQEIVLDVLPANDGSDGYTATILTEFDRPGSDELFRGTARIGFGPGGERGGATPIAAFETERGIGAAFEPAPMIRTPDGSIWHAFTTLDNGPADEPRVGVSRWVPNPSGSRLTEISEQRP